MRVRLSSFSTVHLWSRSYTCNTPRYTYLYNPPVVVALFAQFRIIFTAVIYQCIPGRGLSLKQWYGVVAVFLGCMVAESHNLINGFESNVTGKARGTDTSLLGLSLILTNAVLSCIASVYSEYLLKDMGHTLNWSNMQLYSFGCIFNFFAVVRNGKVMDEGIFKGFGNICAIFSILCFSFMGMTVSAILKKFDSIAKIIGAVIVTLLLTVSVIALPTCQALLCVVCLASKLISHRVVRPTPSSLRVDRMCCKL